MNCKDALFKLEGMIEFNHFAEIKDVYEVFKEKETPKEPLQTATPYGIVMTCQHCHKQIRYWGNYCAECGGKIVNENIQ